MSVEFPPQLKSRTIKLQSMAAGVSLHQWLAKLTGASLCILTSEFEGSTPLTGSFLDAGRSKTSPQDKGEIPQSWYKFDFPATLWLAIPPFKVVRVNWKLSSCKPLHDRNLTRVSVSAVLRQDVAFFDTAESGGELQTGINVDTVSAAIQLKMCQKLARSCATRRTSQHMGHS